MERPSPSTRRTTTVIVAVLALLIASVSTGLVGAAAAVPAGSDLINQGNLSAAAPAGASAVTAVTPFRVLDTRTQAVKPSFGSVVNVPVTDGALVPDDGSVSAVVLNLVALDAEAAGYVTAYAHGETRPGTSSLNVAPGQIQSAQVTVPVGSDGSVDLFTWTPMNVVVDVSGFYQSTAGAAVAAGRTIGVDPERVLDTRSSGQRLAAGASLDVDLAGAVPADATAAVLTVTGVDSAGPGWLDVRPGGTSFAGSSSLNFDIAGDVVANQVLVSLSGSQAVTVQSGVTAVDVVLDLTGYVTGSGSATSQKGLFVPSLDRLLDTRDVAGAASGRIPVSAAGHGGVPATGVAGLTVNVTLTETSGPMWAAALPTGAPAGTTSTVNATSAGQTVAAPATVFSGDALDVYLQKSTELVVDLVGWFTDAPDQQVLYRVNAGGEEVSDTPVWSSDTDLAPSPFRSGGKVSTTAAPIDTSDPSLPAGTPAALFQSERYDQLGGGDMTWSFPAPAGAYTVRLYFAEIYAGIDATNPRTFDVSIEGNLVLNDFDQLTEAGALDKGIMRSFDVTSDGAIDIVFTHVLENPSIKAIEILGTSGGGSVADLVASPSSVGFASTTTGATATKTVTVTNIGDATGGSLDVTGASVTGSGAAAFGQTFSGPVTLGPGESTAFDVTFSPTAAGTVSASLEVTHSGATTPLVVPLSGTGVSVSPGPISFGKSTITGIGTASRPTTLAWGPDGRLYVGYLNGTIQAATVVRSGANNYAVTNVETINLIKNIPNHDDDGTPNASITSRLVTGIDVVGTAANPVIYLTSSDPRIGSPATGDLGMDTNSGIVSKLTWNGAAWLKQDLVRGLPRSKEQHSVEGVIYLPDSNDLLLMAGGQTNEGAPSANFQNVPEYALSAAILRVDLDAIGAGTYDLPTLDDEDRPGVVDANDPFGGNNGKNQAKLVPGGPVQVYASGLRNPYDGVMTSNGLYTIDNGGNQGWGGMPQNEGPSGVCTDNPDNTGITMSDSLHRITAAGYYGGHPNPTRGNMANTFNASNPQSPVSVADPRECDFLPLADRGALATFPTSTNGLAQFTTGNFGGAMSGDLLAAGWDNKIYRVDLSPDGTTASASALFNNVGGFPLDVIAGSATDPFPGTVLVADYGAKAILAFEPADYGGGGTVCTGANDPALDEDADGYTNADEIAAGTDPCSAGDVPSDADGDHISDVTDTDDDNDGILDVNDPFAVDPANGLSTPIPVDFAWDSDNVPGYGILGLGLTGSMVNGSTDWLSAYDVSNMTVIGAAGVVTIDQVPNGTADGVANDQQYGLQVGFDARPANADTFEVSTSLPNPFGVNPPLAGQSYGIQAGPGTQSDFLKLVLSGDNGGELQLVRELGDVPAVLATAPVTVPGPSKIDLFLRIDPDTAAVQASYTVTTGGVTSARTPLGAVFTLPSTWFDPGLAAGLIATSGGAASPLSATWDFLRVLGSPGTLTPAAPLATLSAPAGSSYVAAPSGDPAAAPASDGTQAPVSSSSSLATTTTTDPGDRSSTSSSSGVPTSVPSG